MNRSEKGSLTLEASISYSIFLMIIVSFLFIMRIVYVYSLIQHATAQTAKELSTYSYLYQVAGLGDINQQIQEGTASREGQFNADAGEVVKFYETFTSGNVSGMNYQGTTDPREIIKGMGGALLGNAGREANSQLFQLVVRPMMAGYIGADANGRSADDRLRALRVVDGIEGLNLGSSRFFEDGQTIDLIVCYTIDPIMPIDIMPPINLASRAYIRGARGESVFTGERTQRSEESVWDNPSDAERGKKLQAQDGARNLPKNFPTYSSFDEKSGKAVATLSMDLRDVSYRGDSGARNIKNRIDSKIKKMVDYKSTTKDGVTLKKEDIKKREIIVYIPSETEERKIDRSKFDLAVSELQKKYKNHEIDIVVKEKD